MTRKEALDFLELPDNATDQQARQRLADKLLYFQEQIEKAPSDFLKNLNARHLAKTKIIQKEFPVWSIKQPEISIAFSNEELEEPEVGNNDFEYLTTPVIVSGKSKGKDDGSGKLLPDIPGWLITIASDKPSQTFGLLVGNNYIGRKADPAFNPFILVENDPYLSKVHAIVIIERSVKDNFYLADPPAASRNGIFLNGSTDRVVGKVTLKEGDTIQVGSTKFLLKINSQVQPVISEKTQKNRFVHTVILGNS